jgi:SAM-dependent methyltransferase
MSDSHDPRLDPSSIRARYSDPTAFAQIDPWHIFTANAIQREIARVWDLMEVRPDCVILNAGAGGNNLDLLPRNTINLDLSERRIKGSSHPVVGTVEAIPIKNESIDIVVCVGSVINYCDAASTIAEFQRVLKKGGTLILEFESSKSAEFITTKVFARSAAIVETFYCNQPEAVWVYSPSYISNLLHAAELRSRHQFLIHILSPLALLILRNVRAATFIARLDRLAKPVSFLGQFASNHLVFYQKCI